MWNILNEYVFPLLMSVALFVLVIILFICMLGLGYALKNEMDYNKVVNHYGCSCQN